MTPLIFDIESDGLLDSITKIHCIAVKPVGGELLSFTDHPYHHKAGGIIDALSLLEKSDMIVGHNIQGFDIPAIQKIFPQWKAPRYRDTLIMSRLQRVHEMMKHGLGAWGTKLKFPKGDFGAETDWKEWSRAMHLYCEQDVRLNELVWLELAKDNFPAEAIQLEHEFAKVLDWQMQMGVPFDEAKAQELFNEVNTEYVSLESELKAEHSFTNEEVFIPKRDNRSKGYVAGVPFIKKKTVPFNPGSRQQVVRYFKEKYNWRPSDFTDKNNPKVSGEVFRDMTYPEASKFADYYDTKKLIGQLANGKVAWLKVVKDGRIHGYINHNGAVTSRCTHSGPNLAQVPAVGGFKGEECRSLFMAPTGHSLVGCDASGLELRNLAHYMAPYDSGKYASIILEGDIHTANQDAAGLPTRALAKRFIYAHNYGAGDKKLGAIIKPDSTEGEQKLVGRQARQTFMTRIPALSILLQQVKRAANSRGYLMGLDGRRLYVHSDHVALNVLLQGAGAVVMKKWWVEVWKKAKAEKLRAYPVLHIHDEGQSICEDKDDQVQWLADTKEITLTEVGEHYGYRCRLDGESKIGRSWYDTH